VPLTDPRWIERCSHVHLPEALRITAENDKAGRFAVRDQDNIGRYVCQGVNRLKNGVTFCDNANGVKTVTFPVTMLAGYRFTDNDRKRFTAFLRREGDCLRWTGSRTAAGYGRFKVNGKVISAHYAAFFMGVGCLPADGELDGQRFNVSHNCRNRDCCNRKHLKVKTKRVNLEEREYSTPSLTTNSTQLPANFNPRSQQSLPQPADTPSTLPLSSCDQRTS
jgi:hypothetical protein